MRPLYPMPGFTQEQMLAILMSRQYSFADCFTVVSKDGTTLRYTTVQKDMEVVPLSDPTSTVTQVFSSRGVKVSGLRSKVSVGVTVDEQTLSLAYDATQTYLGQPFAAAILRGRFDGATVRRDRYIRQGPNTPWVGGFPLFVGRVSTADSVGRSAATIKVKSELVLANIDMPRKIFGGTCQWTVFDPDCGLNREDYETNALLEAGSTIDTLVWSGLTDDFKYGVIHIVDQESVTLVRTIKDIQGHNILLVNPLDFVPSAGTNFTIYPGCVRTYDRCARFNNQDRYQAFEFVPKSETAY